MSCVIKYRYNKKSFNNALPRYSPIVYTRYYKAGKKLVRS